MIACMRAVLGIDAAWTQGEPSGVALIADDGASWRQISVAPSYEAFVNGCSGRDVDWLARPSGGPCDPSGLLAAAADVLGHASIVVVAVDMPMATAPICGRRVADDETSRAFGRNGCAVHSPSRARPGPVGEALHRGFARHGFSLATRTTTVATTPALLEVYPHAALLLLLDVDYRIPYKVAKSHRYWPGATAVERQANLLHEFRRIYGALTLEIRALELRLPPSAVGRPFVQLKRYEDALDALVCAWIGSKYLDGGITSYGDDTAAIWVPSRGTPSPPGQRK